MRHHVRSVVLGTVTLPSRIWGQSAGYSSSSLEKSIPDPQSLTFLFLEARDPGPWAYGFAPIAMRNPLTEVAQSKVPAYSLQGKSFSKRSSEGWLSEGLRAQSVGRTVPTRRKMSLKLGPKGLFPS